MISTAEDLSKPLATFGLVSALLYWLVNLNRSRRRPEAPVPPGLPSLPVIGSIPFMAPYSKDHRGFCEMASKFGPIYSLSIGSRYIVVLNSYDVIKEALVDKKLVFSDRGVLYTFLSINPFRKGLVCAPYDKKYMETHRAAMGALRDLGFGTSQMGKVITDEAREVMNEFDVNAGKPIDPTYLIGIAVSNVINFLVFGKRFSHDDDSLKEQVHTFEVVFNLFLHTAPMDFFPALRALPMFGKYLPELKRMSDKLMKFCRHHAYEAISPEVAQDTDKAKDFVTGYKRRYRGPEDEENMMNVIRDFFAAGTETTATTLRWGLIYLANRKHVQEKLFEEINAVVGDSRYPSLEDKAKMPYTNAFISELLRYSSVVPLSLAHEAKEDTVLGGFFIPKGATVFPNLYNVHKDPSLWVDPEQFAPERFLDEDGQLIVNKHLIPFGMGKRSCLGDLLAMQELFLFVTGLVQRFRIEKPEGVEKIDETEIFGVTLAPKPCQLVFERRL